VKCNIQNFEGTDFFIDTPQTTLDSSDAELFVEFPDGRVQVFQPFAPKAAAFAYSPENVFYIYYSGSPKFATAANVACEYVLFNEYNLFFGIEATANAKINYTECEVLKRTLEANDPSWFQGSRRLRPSSRVARTQQITIGKLAGKFHKFGLKRDGISEERIYRFLDQFPEQLVPAMINVLDQIEYYDDELIQKELPKLLQQGAGKMEVFVPLTGLGESAATMSYYLKNAGVQSITLKEALDGRSREITFYEDSLLSGKQASTKILNWFGLEGESKNDKTSPLSEAERKLLRSARVRFCFLIARDKGIAKLRTALERVEINSSDTPLMPQLQSISALALHNDVLGTLQGASQDSHRPKLIDFLKMVGKDLLMSTKHKANPDKWTEARCQECALGYDNLGELVIFMQNAPTSTVTALWKSGGAYDKHSWLPLFPRSEDPVPASTTKPNIHETK